MPDKRERLRALKEEIEREFPLVWFFEDHSGVVDGYWGTESVMFVGERPSLGGVVKGRRKAGAAANSDKMLKRFFARLKTYGFEHAHVTDVVKESGKGGAPLSGEQVDDRNWGYFCEEMSIVQPEVIVALGGRVFHILRKRLERPDRVRLRKFCHYAYRWRPAAEREEIFNKEFEGLRMDLATRGLTLRSSPD